MKFQIRGDRMEVTSALREHVEKRLGKLERYFETPLNAVVNVTMTVIRDVHTIEVTIPLPGLLLRAEERSADMYASIDKVVDKLERQIRKHKTKVNRKFRQEGSIKTLFKESADAALNALKEDDEDELEVVRTKRFTLKPMDVEEAILQMNLIGHTFFVFSNMDTSQVNVVYKRDDGKYGLIEPTH